VLLLHLEGQRGAFHLQRVVDLGHLVARELDVDDGADALDDLALCHVDFLQTVTRSLSR
jgi:hypothetical protein